MKINLRELFKIKGSPKADSKVNKMIIESKKKNNKETFTYTFDVSAEYVDSEAFKKELEKLLVKFSDKIDSISDVFTYRL